MTTNDDGTGAFADVPGVEARAPADVPATAAVEAPAMPDAPTVCVGSGPAHRSRLAAVARERLSLWGGVSSTRLATARDDVGRMARRHPVAAATLVAGAAAALVGLLRVARRRSG